MFTFNHFNFNVKNLEESLKFYHDALGLEEISRNDQPDFTIVFLGDGKTGFRLELTYMKGRTKPYDLGEQEYHLALTADNFEKAHAYHKKNGSGRILDRDCPGRRVHGRPDEGVRRGLAAAERPLARIRRAQPPAARSAAMSAYCRVYSS